jgi:hypothetical protein
VFGAPGVTELLVPLVPLVPEVVFVEVLEEVLFVPVPLIVLEVLFKEEPVPLVEDVPVIV